MKHTLSHGRTRLPGIPAVEAERDLVDAARVDHHQVETGLKDCWGKKAETVSEFGLGCCTYKLVQYGRQVDLHFI